MQDCANRKKGLNLLKFSPSVSFVFFYITSTCNYCTNKILFIDDFAFRHSTQSYTNDIKWCTIWETPVDDADYNYIQFSNLECILYKLYYI